MISGQESITQMIKEFKLHGMKTIDRTEVCLEEDEPADW
jgi:hypothetical protein